MKQVYNELAVMFGRSGTLLGILTRPLPHVRKRLPAIVVLNTGIAHRVGHNRMYVTLARELASRGHTVFRFDLSGIGAPAPAVTGSKAATPASMRVRDFIVRDGPNEVAEGHCAAQRLHCGNRESRTAPHAPPPGHAVRSCGPARA